MGQPPSGSSRRPARAWSRRRVAHYYTFRTDPCPCALFSPRWGNPAPQGGRKAQARDPAAVGSSPRLSASQIEAESAADAAAGCGPASAGAASRLAVPRTGASYRPDITAIRLARQATGQAGRDHQQGSGHDQRLPAGRGEQHVRRRPGDIRGGVGRRAAAIHDRPGSRGLRADSRADSRLCASAADSVNADTASPAPIAASRTPVSRRSSRLLARTAASVARPATTRASAYGTSAAPVTLTRLSGSGRGRTVCTCAQVCLVARKIIPAPIAPSSSVIVSSRRGEPGHSARARPTGRTSPPLICSPPGLRSPSRSVRRLADHLRSAQCQARQSRDLST